MKTLTAAKTRLHVNNVQASRLAMCIDVRRVAFNFALGRWQTMYDAWKADNTLPMPSASEIDKQFNAEKAARYPWLYDNKGFLTVPNCVGQEAIKHDIKQAFQSFFRRVKNGETPGYPKFKRRGQHESFTLTSVVLNNRHLHGDRLTLPKGWGVARLGNPVPEGKIKSVTISQRAGKWWIAFLLETNHTHAPCERGAVGIDLGVAQFASLSNGIVYDSAKALEKHQTRLKGLQRKLAKMEKGSNRYFRQKARIAKLYKHIADTRVSHAHKITAELAKKHDLIVLEDLNVKNMTKSAKGNVEEPGKQVKQKSGLNRSLLNQNLYEFKWQLKYKTARRGGILITVNPAHTSQTCSHCGHVAAENRKTQAIFACIACGHHENADTNAAKNILNRGVLQYGDIGRN
ncbi:MAG: transposase [Methylococcales bacterium]|nr:transposase [Methylococcales bacterium]